jgi:hypothetical protein
MAVLARPSGQLGTYRAWRAIAAGYRCKGGWGGVGMGPGYVGVMDGWPWCGGDGDGNGGEVEYAVSGDGSLAGWLAEGLEELLVLGTEA